MIKSRERIVQERFDSFIKTISRNYVRNYKVEVIKRWHYEKGVENFDDVMAEFPLYRRPAGVFYFNGCRYEVYHYELAMALKELPRREREIIMAKYWGARPGRKRVPDAELAKYFKMSYQKMYRYQQRILHKLRESMERMDYYG